MDMFHHFTYCIYQIFVFQLFIPPFSFPLIIWRNVMIKKPNISPQLYITTQNMENLLVNIGNYYHDMI